MQREIDNHKKNRNDQIIRLLNEVYANFKQGLFDESIDLLEEALKIDFDYPGVTSSLKCSNFWRERLFKMADISDCYEKGEFLLKQWDLFSQFLDQTGEISERCLFSIKQYIFHSALVNYQQLLEDSDFLDPEILLKMGRCHKSLGNYDEAVACMEKALQQKSGSAEIMAQLADCYSLVNDIKLSKILFREAFFIDPGGVNITLLESEMIKKLIRKIRERGIPEKLINDWIPVYGTIFGVFNIKRELKSLEIGKLKQAVYQLERNITASGEAARHLVPGLLNSYFWLIDYYLSSGEDKIKIEEILSKIKELDLDIYEEYTN